MDSDNECFVCRDIIEKEEKFQEFEEKGKRIVVHEECVSLFASLVRTSLQSVDTKEPILEEPDYSALPAIHKDQDSDYEALEKLLKWAEHSNPKGGLTPSEAKHILKDRYRRTLSNASARLGELVEQGKARRVKEDNMYRYFVAQGA